MVVPPSLLIDPFCDHHVHTKLCGHAVGEMEEYVEMAIAKGLRKLIFLEHLEKGISTPHRTWLSAEDFTTYFRVGERLQEQYKDQIEIGLGVECGYNPVSKDILNKKLQERPWAWIGLSCHFVALPGDSHHINLFSRNPESHQKIRAYGTAELFSLYFKRLIEAVQSLPANMLCHLDGALRHLPECLLGKDHLLLIEELLDLVVETEMTLEINTSGLRLRGEQFPAGQVLEMAVAKKIPFCLSSDAHRPEDVAHAFDRFR